MMKVSMPNVLRKKIFEVSVLCVSVFIVFSSCAASLELPSIDNIPALGKLPIDGTWKLQLQNRAGAIFKIEGSRMYVYAKYGPRVKYGMVVVKNIKQVSPLKYACEVAYVASGKVVFVNGEVEVLSENNLLVRYLPNPSANLKQVQAETYKKVRLDDESLFLAQLKPGTRQPAEETKTRTISDIRRAQTLLAELGYDSVPIDGILGEQTRKAIIEFQLDVRAPVTGEVNKNLLSQLEIAYQLAKIREELIPPVQVSKPSPRKYDKISRVAKVLPVMPSKVNKQPLSAADLFRKVRISVFVVVAGSSIQAFQRIDELSQGSAVAVSHKNLLTNCHILKNKPYVLVIQGEEAKAARLSGKDEESDMCVLTTEESNLTHVDAIRKFDDLIVGEKVYTVGTPIGLEQTLGEGIISGLRRYKGHKLIQTSAPISSGSSGGGLFDSNGNLIGITTFLLKDAQNLNFAIAAEQYWD